ncbi:MAG: hypothetical protein Q4E71_06660, partial [Prevotella sp.]|nr:hypothetical protein [Prevotella sp.]
LHLIIYRSLSDNNNYDTPFFVPLCLLRFKNIRVSLPLGGAGGGFLLHKHHISVQPATLFYPNNLLMSIKISYFAPKFLD